MNCLEFRRRLLNDPSDRSQAFLQHKRSCIDCAAEVSRIAVLEDQLGSALRIDVPEGLESRILLRRAFGERRNPWRAWRLGLAASVLLSVGVGGWIGYFWGAHVPDYSELQAAVLEHIHDEPEYLSVDENVGSEQLDTLLAGFGARMESGLGHVRHAGSCSIRSQDGVHLVLDGDDGPITVLILPGESVSGRIAVRSPGLEGVIIPAPRGSISIVGEPGTSLERTEQRIERALVWM